MALPNAVQGARHTAPGITWLYSDGTAVDLTGATITGYKVNVNTGVETALDGSLVLDADPTTGVFYWTYGSVDVAEAGRFLVQFIATFGAGNEEKHPLLSWYVHPALDV